MYSVVARQHFEDWYVADYGEESFESFDDAMQSLVDKCLEVINDGSSGDGIDDYITDNHEDLAEEFPEWTRDYSKGFFFALKINDKQVFYLHLDYELETSSISSNVSFEVEENELRPNEVSRMHLSLVTIRDGLAESNSG